MSRQDEFIKVVGDLARKECESRDRWILPSVCIAQAALESGWNLEASTLFGIKGNGVTTPTQEFINGQWVTITDNFEYYPNIQASVKGYYDFLSGTPRYAKALNEKDYRKAVDGLIHTLDGLPYATAPNYIEIVCSIIEQYDLTRYDSFDCSDPEKITASMWDGKETYFDSSLYGDYKCMADALVVRCDAGVDKEVLRIIFEDCPVLCSGFYRYANDMKWLMIQFYDTDHVPCCGWASMGMNLETYLERT